MEVELTIQLLPRPVRVARVLEHSRSDAVTVLVLVEVDARYEINFETWSKLKAWA